MLPATKSASSASGSGVREALIATLLYGVLTIVFTWPLCLDLTRNLAGDFGDPLLNAWILAWDATHLGRGWWNANIYFPHPLTLAYSEHLLPQAIGILPVHLIAKNPILNYNLVFLSTFVLSGLGMFLFVREITGNRAAAFLAGVAFAFAPYRVTQIPHVQVLSSQWMPFALYGFRRYFDSVRTWRPALAGHTPAAAQSTPVGPPKGGRHEGGPHVRLLVGGAAAWIIQNLSCGYYLLFFGPVLVAYLAWEMTTRALWRQKRVVLSVAAAGAVVVAVAFVFTRPYLELRELGFKPRSLQETMTFSADVLAYFTADPNLRLWGPVVKKWPWPEGALFPGVVIVLLAAIGVGAAARPFEVRVRGTDASPAYKSPTLIAFVASVGLVTALLLGYTIRTPILQITSFTRTLAVLAAVWGLVWLRSADTRREVRQWLATPAGFFTLAAVFAIVMSFGPTIHSRGRLLVSTNLYMLFYNWVPGFDGVRTAARFAMIVTLAVAVLGGIGSAAIARIVGSRAILLLAGVIMLEGIAVPLPLNQNPLHYKRPGLAPLPASVVDVPPIYAFVSTLPPSAAIAELPMGETAFDVRYMFFSTTHWRPLVNGYSGGGPAAYERLEQTLQDALTRPEPAWQALAASQASHVIVHEAFYAEDRGPRISEWLRSHGAQELAVFGSDRIFRIR